MRFSAISVTVLLMMSCLHASEGAESEGATTGGSSSTGETGETTEVGGRCGDGTVDVGEGCDDGNDVEEDGCPSGAAGQCKAEAVCGDGVVWAGMEEIGRAHV